MARDYIQEMLQTIGGISNNYLPDIPDFVFGEVTSLEPFKVNLGETGTEVTEPFLIMGPFGRDKKISITVDGQGGSQYLWRGFSEGDRIILGRSTNGQKYLALWRADGITDYNDELSWDLTSSITVDGAGSQSASNLVQMARSQIGVSEIGSSNNVIYNTWYYGRTVSGTAYPWCAVFISWCANQAGISNNIIPRSAAVAEFERFYRARGRLYNSGAAVPSPGDLYSYSNSSHIGIVESGNSATAWTGIEGNTSNSVQRRSVTSGGVRYIMKPQYATVAGSHDVDILSRVIYLEGGQSSWVPDHVLEKMACVVVNRVNDPRYPNTVEGVLSQPGQFATWPYINTITPNQKSINAASSILTNGSNIPSNVIYFANFLQGSGLYYRFYNSYGQPDLYFCYG